MRLWLQWQWFLHGILGVGLPLLAWSLIQTTDPTSAQDKLPVQVAPMPTTAHIAALPNSSAALPPSSGQTAQVKVSLPAVPEGFSPQWGNLALDEERITLRVLKAPFSLRQTTLGAEAFEYSAGLFEQLAGQLPSPQAAGTLGQLSMQSQELAHALRKASSARFDGPPTEDLTHLHVRSEILSQLSELNAAPLRTIDRNNQGQRLEGESPAPAAQAGEGMHALETLVEELAAQPEMQGYPETLALVKEEVARLKNIALHTELRWESTFDCQSTDWEACHSHLTRMKVYTRQTLPPEQFRIRTAVAAQ